MENFKLLKKKLIYIFVIENTEYLYNNHYMSNYSMHKLLEITHLDLNAIINNKLELFKIMTSKNKKILPYIFLML